MAASACTVHNFSHPHVASTSQYISTLSTPINRTLSFPRYRSDTYVVTVGFSTRAAKSDSGANVSNDKKKEVLEEEEEEEMPWIQEKALDLVEFTGSVTQAIPGPRIGSSSFPWILAVPLTYFGITFVIAFVKTVRKFNSPREKRKKLVNKNAELCKSIDELFEKGKDFVEPSTLKGLAQKPQKSPVVMDISGYSEKGLKRKLAVQTLFGKIYYLSELPEFCSRDSSLTVKEIFGVADEDAEKLRLHTIPEAGNMDSLERMVNGSDSE
ncbi:hypothetical protein EJD97_000239 [Solanum chilense]|uniref:Armadillo-like repeats domain-containing protein n=1 Tax=Solanum chilense TaxID=4083 RepID=A0A6N2C7K6_SOLCI|nr:hypothetical protein EJD97_000239 [Solanum chilense]